MNLNFSSVFAKDYKCFTVRAPLYSWCMIKLDVGSQSFMLFLIKFLRKPSKKTTHIIILEYVLSSIILYEFTILKSTYLLNMRPGTCRFLRCWNPAKEIKIKLVSLGRKKVLWQNLICIPLSKMSKLLSISPAFMFIKICKDLFGQKKNDSVVKRKL